MRGSFKRISITTYLNEHFGPGDRSRPTVINDIRKGRLPGELLGGKWYVFVDDDNIPINSTTHYTVSTAAPILTGNKIADAILSRRKP